MKTTRRAWHDRPLLWFAVLVTAGWLTVAGFAALTAQPRVAPAAPPPVGMAAVAPDDGDLQVGGVRVAQLAGTCADQVCRYVVPDPATLPTVAVPAGGSVPVSSQVSTQFSVGVSGGDPGAAPTFTVADGQLAASPGAAGSWVLSVSGSAGGVWQFVVDVQPA